MGDAMTLSIWEIVFVPPSDEDIRLGATFTVAQVYELCGGKRSDMAANWIPEGAIFYEGEHGQYLVVTKDRKFAPTEWNGSRVRQPEIIKRERQPGDFSQRVDIFLGNSYKHGLTRERTVKVG